MRTAVVSFQGGASKKANGLSEEVAHNSIQNLGGVRKTPTGEAESRTFYSKPFSFVTVFLW